MIHNDVLVRRQGEPDVDLKAGAVPMFVARGDHRHAACRDAMIVRFEALDFIQYLSAGGIRGFRTFESDLRVNLHGLSFGCAMLRNNGMADSSFRTIIGWMKLKPVDNDPEIMIAPERRGR